MAFALSRSSNFRSQSWGRRFTEVQRQLLTGNLLLNSLSEGSVRELSALLDMKIRDGLDPEALSGEIRLLVNQSFSHVPQLIAVSGQVEYKGLVPVQLIGRAMAERSEVPWDALFAKFPALAAELTTTSQYITDIGSDKHAGIKYGRVSQEIKNLLYFCVRALIILEGEESLRNYAGFGGDSSQSAVPMKITLDAILDRLKERQVKLASEVDVDVTDAPSRPYYEASINKIIRFTKTQDDKSSGPPPDDDDDDDPPPGPSGGLFSIPPPDEGMDTTDDAFAGSFSPEPEEDETTSVRSGTSSVKRRATSHERPPVPSKRTTRAHTTDGFFPMFKTDERNQVTVTTLLEIVDQLTVTQLSETAKKKDNSMGQFIWKSTETTKVQINIAAQSDESYFNLTRDILSILTQGKANITITHHFSSKSETPINTLQISADLIHNLTLLQPSLLEIPIGQIVVGLVCFLFQWGLKGTKVWSATTITQEAPPGLLSYIDKLIEINPTHEKFFQDCYQSLVSRKSKVLLFDLQTVIPQ